MPELPEVETTLRGISPYILEKSIQGITVRNPNLRWQVNTTELALLHGSKIDCIRRRAKYLIFSTQDGHILWHLGMSGSFLIVDHHQPLKKHDHIDIVFQDKILRYNDPRRFGCCLYIKKSKDNIEINNHPLLSHLGPEPISDEFNDAYLFKYCKKSNAHIKNLIMNNKIVVGVGNIYANEALFLAGIRPTRKASTLSKTKCQHLCETIKNVLSKAIKAGGTTLKDFVQADGRAGYFTQQLHVYGKGGNTCGHCQSIIKTKKIGQRNSFYCPNCQK